MSALRASEKAKGSPAYLSRAFKGNVRHRDFKCNAAHLPRVRKLGLKIKLLMGQSATINFLVQSVGDLGGAIEYLHREVQAPNMYPLAIYQEHKHHL